MAQLFLSSKGQACRALACSDPTNSQWLAGGGGAQWGWITSIVGAWVHGIHHPLVRLEGWMACSNGNGNGNDPETASDRYGAWSVRRGEASIPFASLRFFSRLPLFPSCSFPSLLSERASERASEEAREEKRKRQTETKKEQKTAKRGNIVRDPGNRLEPLPMLVLAN